MTVWNRKQLASLVKKDRIHRNIYTDPEVFDLEMDRIFGAAWVYVGHDSEVPNVGDFFTTNIGTQPVVVVRHTDGKVHVLFNRCGHRGAVVENLPKGNAKHFRCCYHGWVFKTDGELASVPLKNGYPENFDLTDPMLGMVPVPRVEAYRGFVFANLGGEGPGLLANLGGAKSGIDDICDRAPAGEVEVFGGYHKYLVDGNWKFQAENIVDLYHPLYSHESTLVGEGRQFKRRGSDDGGLQITDDRGNVNHEFDMTGVWSFGRGHGAIGAGPAQQAERGGPVFAEYKRRMIKAYGEKRTAEILSYNRHNTLFYPNLVIQSLAQHVRIIKPVAVDRTEVWVTGIRLKGAPEEMHEDVIKYLNVTHSAASFVQTDDVECFKRCHQGAFTQGADWVLLNRGFGAEAPDKKIGGVRSPGTHEIGMRGQYAAWKKYMTVAA